jgi:tRNA isopentenyl-2-thiomethyl-A-37 hydroxylase MiaE
MTNPQMEKAVQDIQDTLVVMAYIEKRQTEHLSELLRFRVHSEEFQRRTEQNLAEITDKLNGLIGFVAGQKGGAQ